MEEEDLSVLQRLGTNVVVLLQPAQIPAPQKNPSQSSLKVIPGGSLNK